MTLNGVLLQSIMIEMQTAQKKNRYVKDTVQLLLLQQVIVCHIRLEYIKFKRQKTSSK